MIKKLCYEIQFFLSLKICLVLSEMFWFITRNLNMQSVIVIVIPYIITLFQNSEWYSILMENNWINTILTINGSNRIRRV